LQQRIPDTIVAAVLGGYEQFVKAPDTLSGLNNRSEQNRTEQNRTDQMERSTKE